MLAKKKISFSKVCVITILTLIMFVCIIPFLIILSTSTSSEVGIQTRGYTIIPHELCFDAYRYVFAQPEQIISSYLLTIFVAATGTIIGTLIMTMFAYTISRSDYKLKGFLSFFAYFTMLFNGGMVSNYIWFTRYLHLANNTWALILPLMVSAWNIFVLRIFCKSIPTSLIESAKVEGANEFRIFASIIFPLAKTGVATIALLLLFTYWNDWFLSMMYMDTADDITLQYYLVKILNNIEFIKENETASGGMVNMLNVPDESARMAICTLAVAPMTIVFPFFQKYFVKGLVVGSVKG